MHPRLRTLVTLALLFAGLVRLSAAADTYTITLDPAVGAAMEKPATGRIILFFITETGREWDRQRPIDGPFFEKPQPIASVPVRELRPGQSVTINAGEVFAFPHALDAIDGTVRVQAILDQDQTERSHAAGPGNVYSEVMTVELAADREDHVELVLSNVVQPRALPEAENLRWVELRSEMLSTFYGRDVYHRAGVALPLPYLDPEAERQQWPAVYVVPGFGGRHEGAVGYAQMFQARGIEEVAPMAITIVLDPESPLGHHGFTDSPNHGPRGTALVREFIPYLESKFRLAASPHGRILTGHSSGGWTSLWLQLNWPDVFGGCWASAPDPIDFRAFQMTNIYADESMYVMPDGSETPSYRVPVSMEEEAVAMTVREEVLMEYAIHPEGGSGQQWDTWAAMFSPRSPDTGYPARMFDPLTGRIDREIVERHWSKLDMSKLIASDWGRFGPIVLGRVRLACGESDSYYLERAVKHFKERVEQLTLESGMTPGAGYIHLEPHATHGSVVRVISMRWNREMREHLRAHGLHD
jgi:hypothetical protein